jgi:antagonist of KipI
LNIQKIGIQTSVQDLGRTGYRKYGISAAGAMHRWSIHCINAILNNPSTAPVIEFTFPGPEIVFEEHSAFALYGADFSAELNGSPLQLGRCYLTSPGDVLHFRRRIVGEWCYLGFKGKTTYQKWLGSYSRDPLVKHPALPREMSLSPVTSVPKVRLPSIKYSTIIPIVPGPYFSKPNDAVYTIDPQSNRMGYRLNGPEVSRPFYQERISAPVQRGTVQLLPSGQLIVLMADAQTIGGYPVWGYVPQEGTDSLAQLGSNGSFSWQIVSWEDVERKNKEIERHLLQIQLACQQAWKSIVT